MINLILVIFTSTIAIYITMHAIKSTFIFYYKSKNYLTEYYDFLNTSSRIKEDLYKSINNTLIRENEITFTKMNYSSNNVIYKNYKLLFNGTRLVYENDTKTHIIISDLIKDIGIYKSNNLNSKVFYIEFIYPHNTFRRYYEIF